MTLKEGAREALKRLGVCEAHIEARLQYAQTMAPNSPNELVPPGKEEEWIQYVMETFKKLQTPEGQAELDKRIVKMTTRN